MTAFVALAAALSVATLALLTRPLWWRPSGRPVQPEPPTSIGALREQIGELDAAHAAGSIADEDHARARAALERQIVASVMGGPTQPARSDGTAPNAIVLGLGLTVCIVAFAGLGYFAVGTPQALAPKLADAPPAASAPLDAASITPQQIEQLIERLTLRLKEQPGDIEGWTILGRSHVVLGRHDAAAEAFKQALALRPDDAMLMAHYADALATAGQSFKGEPERLIERALASDPGNLKALALAGSAAFDRADYPTALRHFENLSRLAPNDEFRAQVQAGIDESRRRASSPQGTAAGATAAATQLPPPPVAASAISGSVSLSPALAAKAQPDDAVFVFARPASGGGMPLAILRKQVRDLPLSFTLDDSLAMSPQHKLSTASSVVVAARISRSGQAMPSPGDLQGSSSPVQPGAREVRIHIADVVGP